MPKARHRKRVRTARLDATAAPLATGSTATEPDANGASSSTTTAAAGTKKVGKKEAEVTNLLDKLRSDNVDERIWASVSTGEQKKELGGRTRFQRRGSRTTVTSEQL